MLFCLDLKSVAGRSSAINRTSFGTSVAQAIIVTPAVYLHLVLNYDIQPTQLRISKPSVRYGRTYKQTNRD